MKKLMLKSLLFAMIGLFTFSQVQAEERVVATVNGTPILQSQVNAVMGKKGSQRAALDKIIDDMGFNDYFLIVYDFVKSNNSKQKIFVTENLDNIEDIHNAEFVYGVGIKDKLSDIGIKGIELNDLLKDIIFDNQKWDSRSISRLCLPTLHATYIPYFKYLSSAGYLNNNGLIDKEIDVTEFSPHFISTVNSIQRDNFYPGKNYLKNKDEINTKYNSISEIINDKNNSDLNCLVCISLLDNDKICLNELEDFLKSREHLFQDKKYS